MTLDLSESSKSEGPSHTYFLWVCVCDSITFLYPAETENKIIALSHNLFHLKVKFRMLKNNSLSFTFCQHHLYVFVQPRDTTLTASLATTVAIKLLPFFPLAKR